MGKVDRMIPRAISSAAQQRLEWYPILSLTGPRQSGKSTLLKSLFPDYEYVNLENPTTRALASEDPIGFLRNKGQHLIIDEAQYVPELFSVVQVLSDERNENGQYILSGSQNFLLLKQIKQSLAGRVSLLKLLPLSYHELSSLDEPPSLDLACLQGGYPRLYDSRIAPSIFFGDYLETYIERDISGFMDVRDSRSFRTFLGLCATNAGNLVNFSDLARNAGIAFRTAQSWLSLLESSYITFSLQPWFSNIGKRLTKTPKLYFYDTGLLCYLLGIRTQEQLPTSPFAGAIFENFIVSETLKNYYNRGERPELYFYRDDSKVEVDLLDFTDPANRRLYEIKTSQTYHSRLARAVISIGDALGIPAQGRIVLYQGDEELQSSTHTVMNANHYLSQLM